MSAPRVRGYRWLLTLLPRELRERHGRAMEALVGEEIEATRSRGRLAVARVWCAAAWDVVRRAPYEHWRRREHSSSQGMHMDSLLSDLRFAARSFARQPGSTLLVVVTLALGIAANTAAFTLINGLFLRPFPFPESDRLVYLNETAPRWNLEFTSIFYPDFDKWHAGTHAFEAMALYDDMSVNLSADATPERVNGASVTHDLARVLRVQPLLGRMFDAQEDKPGAPPVVVIGHAMWQTRFAGARDIVGRTVRINGRPTTIVGVLPPNIEFPAGAQFWIPVAGDPAQPCCAYSYSGIGRLRAGMTVAAARADLVRAHEPIWAARDTGHVVSPRLLDLREFFVRDFSAMGQALGAAVALVLLVACANVASLMLARAVFRRREIAVRMALGAGGRRLTRQLLTESLALAAVAGVAGALLGQWSLRLLLRVTPDRLPAWARFDVDARTIGFVVAVVAVTALLFGCVPALQSRHTDVRGALAAAGGRASPSAAQRRLLNGLVIAEFALAAVLLVGSGLLLRAYQRTHNADPGFRADHVLSFRIALPDARYTDGAARLAFYEDLVNRLRVLPGVVSAGAVSCPPFGCHQGDFLEAEGQADVDHVILTRLATPGYIETMGIPVLHGRAFTADDDRTVVGRTTSPRAILVDETFASRFWPGVADPTGRRVRFQGDTSATAWRTVVGVVKEVKHYGLDAPPRPGIYLPAAVMQPHDGSETMSVAMRTASDPATFIAGVRTIVRQMDPELPLYQVQTMAEALDRSLALRRAFAWTLAVLAGIALTLAIGGIYGVLTYIVGRRTREMGIRVALGARRAQVMRMVVRQGLGLVTIGLVIGLPAALGASRILASLLAGVSTRDPVTFGGVAVILTLTGLVAAFLPARRAARVEPRSALVDE